MDGIEIYINKHDGKNVYKFENLEELREFDGSYAIDTENEIMKRIADTFDVSQGQIWSH